MCFYTDPAASSSRRRTLQPKWEVISSDMFPHIPPSPKVKRDRFWEDNLSETETTSWGLLQTTWDCVEQKRLNGEVKKVLCNLKQVYNGSFFNSSQEVLRFPGSLDHSRTQNNEARRKVPRSIQMAFKVIGNCILGIIISRYWLSIDTYYCLYKLYI